MSWAEVLKINSDLNKPLDKLIKGLRGYVVSDNLYYIVDDTNYSLSVTTDGASTVDTSYEYPSFKFGWDGSVKLKVSYNITALANYQNNFAISLFGDNGSRVDIVRTNIYERQADWVEIEYVLTIQKDVVYTPTVVLTIFPNSSSVGTGSGWAFSGGVKEFRIYADVVDFSGFEIISD